MKLAEILKRPNLDPLMSLKAKKMLQRMSKTKGTEKEADTPTGWRADPSQGSLGGSLNWR